MITPVNDHLVIEPVVHDSFIASQKETYQEIGIVIATSHDQAPVGTKVYFDAWLAAKYPKPDGKDGEYYWLVQWADIRAVEYAEST